MRSRLLLIPTAVVLAASPAAGLDFETLAAGQANLFPNANLIPIDFSLTDPQVDRLQNEVGVPVLHPQVKVWKASTGGWLFLDQVYGLNDIITYLVALDDKGAVRGVEILVCVEGFCDISTREWRAQFTGKKMNGFDPKAQISNISGETLSATHVAQGVKKVLAIHAMFMPEKKR
jgi:hypothetical protein